MEMTETEKDQEHNYARGKQVCLDYYKEVF